MKHSNFPIVAIGGLGGSGTRVVAAALQTFGYNIGTRLNVPLDNLWFTVLFKRRAWSVARPDPADVRSSISLFQRATASGLNGNINKTEQDLITTLCADLHPHGNWRPGATTMDAESLIASTQGLVPANVPWGWKEPNTHIFLPYLEAEIPNFHYIHVVRNGMDMAFSKNTWQMRHWAHLYDLPTEQGNSVPSRQLQFWTAANRAAMDYGMKYMPSRFLTIYYDDFCVRSEHHLNRMRRFIGAPETTALTSNLIKTTTIGRAADQCLSSFSKKDIEAAKQLQSELATEGT